MITSVALNDALLNELAALRLMPGEEVEFVQVLPLGGPVLVRTTGGFYALGRLLADRLWVAA